MPVHPCLIVVVCLAQAREAGNREMARSAAQAELVKMHRLADVELATRKETYAVVPNTRRDETQLKRMVKSLSEVLCY